MSNKFNKPINYEPLIVNYLRDSNIAKYQSIMSDEEVLTELLKRADSINQNKGEQQLSKITEEEIKAEALRAVADVLQSITTEGLFTVEILQMIYERYGNIKKTINGKKVDVGKKIIDVLSNMFKIVHGANHSIPRITGNNNNSDFSELPFSIPFEVPEKSGDLYKHNSTYGIISSSLSDEARREVASSEETVDSEGIRDVFADQLASQNGNSEIDFTRSTHSVDYIINNKIFKANNEIEDKEDLVLPIFVNKTDEDSNVLLTTKKDPSLAYILVDSPNLRIGTRNSIELATFFNTLSTIELSKCQPFFNATFILPSEIKNKSGKIFKTASVTQFLNGTPLKKDSVTENYKTMEASFIRTLNTSKGRVDQAAVDTNISAFTMPQTINNFNEYHVGHNENMPFFTDKNFKRATSVHDYTRPFLTIKSFDIDVAPTQGLMSFKTGKLSIVLHDRTRMTDIAPFIKPDMFGSFGAEIAIEYGWSHMDAGDKSNKTNYVAEFLNNSRVVEKYIITNSSFSMDKNGQVNIDLAIAMRGPIDIRTASIVSDPPSKASIDRFRKAQHDFRSELSGVGSEGYRVTEYLTQPLFAEISSIAGSDTLAFKNAKLELCRKFVKAFRGNYKQAFKNIKLAQTVKQAQDATLKELKQNRSVYNTNNSFNGQLKKRKAVNDNTTLDDLSDVRFDNGETLNEKIRRNAASILKNNKSNEIKKGRSAFEKRLKSITSVKSFEALFKRLQMVGNKDIIASVPLDIKEEALNRDSTEPGRDIGVLASALAKFYDVYLAVSDILVIKDNAIAKQKKVLQKMISSLDIVDPFYNKEWLKQYHKIVLDEEDVDGMGIKEQGIGGEESSIQYVTLGSLLTGLIGTHLVSSGKFDEIQVVSYTLNEKCGLMSNLNVSSLLIPKNELSNFLDKLFERGTTMTIESLTAQIIERFITTRRQICYGLEDFYSIDSAGNTKAIVSKRKLEKNTKINRKEAFKLKNIKKKILTTDEFNDQINLRLSKIYHCLADEKIKPSEYFDSKTEIIDNVEFLLPKIKLSFDTMTSKRDGYQRTICRISVFDENDNPFGSIHSIMKKIYDEGAISYAAKLNRLRRDYRATGREEKNKKNNSSKRNAKLSKEEFYKKQGALIDELIKSGVLVKISKDLYEIRSRGLVGGTIKSSIKNIMPAITYGSQNSIVIDASVSTINETKLNTVYLTRADRGGDGEQVAAKVSFQKDLPLRILPAQSNITMFGCPFANFAQYIFLDFETGTTIDNAYAITGIKHSITPGKFTTSLTLSYGDVYGKYESTASTLAREITDRNEQTRDASNPKPSKKKKEESQSNTKVVRVREILSFIKTPDYRNLKPFSEIDNVLVDNRFIPIKLKIKSIDDSEVILAKEIKFTPRIKTYLSDRNIVTIDRINSKKSVLEVNVRHFLYGASLNETETETINATLNILEDKSVRKIYDDYITEVKSNISGKPNVDILRSIDRFEDEFKVKDDRVSIFNLNYDFLFKDVNTLVLDLIKEFTEINLKYSVNVSNQKISSPSLEKVFNLNFNERFNNQTEKIAKFLKKQFQTNLKSIESLEVTKEQILAEHNLFISDDENALKLEETQAGIQELKDRIELLKSKSNKDIISEYIRDNEIALIEKEAFRSIFNSIEINGNKIEFRYSRYYKTYTIKQKRVLANTLSGFGVYNEKSKTYEVPSNYSGQYLIPSELKNYKVSENIAKNEVHIINIEDFMGPMITAIKAII